MAFIRIGCSSEETISERLKRFADSGKSVVLKSDGELRGEEFEVARGILENDEFNYNEYNKVSRGFRINADGPTAVTFPEVNVSGIIESGDETIIFVTDDAFVGTSIKVTLAKKTIEER